jgi:hypothetical protein
LRGIPEKKFFVAQNDVSRSQVLLDAVDALFRAKTRRWCYRTTSMPEATSGTGGRCGRLSSTSL